MSAITLAQLSVDFAAHQAACSERQGSILKRMDRLEDLGIKAVWALIGVLITGFIGAAGIIVTLIATS